MRNYYWYLLNAYERKDLQNRNIEFILTVLIKGLLVFSAGNEFDSDAGNYDWELLIHHVWANQRALNLCE